MSTNKVFTVLAVGASSPSAGLVVPALAARGVHVRGFVQHEEERGAVLKEGAFEAAVGDLADGSSVDAALKNIDAVFYIAPAFDPRAPEMGKNMVDAARKAGVRRFVFSSVLDPVLSALVNHRAKAPVEEAVIESGMEYTILQPAMFFQNTTMGWPMVLKTGVFAEPWAMETRFTRVDYRDVAEVAVIALTEDQLLYGTYQLCGEGNLNRSEVAALMSEVLERKIEAANLSPDKAAPAPGGDDPMQDERTTALKAMFRFYNKHSLMGNPLTLRAILGREPRTLLSYLEELAAGSQTEGSS